MFLTSIFFVCVIVSIDSLDSKVYVDDIGTVKTKNSENTDELGGSNFEQRISKQRKAGNIYTETHLIKHYPYDEPMHELPFMNLPSIVLPQFQIKRPVNLKIMPENNGRVDNNRPQSKHLLQRPPLDQQFNPASKRDSPASTERNAEQTLQNEHKKLPQDLKLNFGDDWRTEKDDYLNTSVIGSSVNQTDNNDTPTNKPEIFIEKKVESAAPKNDKKQDGRLALVTPVHRNRSDQEVTVNNGFKVYIDGEDSGSELTANKNRTDKTILKDDGRIFFEPELSAHTTENSNIMKIDKGKVNVSTTTDKPADVGDLDNRNVFDVTVTCKQGTVHIEGKCVPLD